MDIYFRRPTRMALAVLTVSLIMSAVIAIAVILIGEFGDIEAKILATTGCLTFFSILTLPSLFHLERGRYTHIAWLGIATSVLAFTLIELSIWEIGRGTENVFKFMMSLLSVGVAINYSFLITFATSTNTMILLWQSGTIFSIILSASIILFAIWSDLEPLWQPFAVFCILSTVGSILLPILARITRTRAL